MAITGTLLWAQSFDHGLADGPGLITGANYSIVTGASAHEDGYGLRCSWGGSGSYAAQAFGAPASEPNQYATCRVRFNTKPNANVFLVYTRHGTSITVKTGIGYNASTNKLRAVMHHVSSDVWYYGTDSSVDIEEDVWYLLEWRTRPPTSTRQIIDWALDGALETTFDQSGISTFTGPAYIYWGDGVSGATSGEVDFDDCWGMTKTASSTLPGGDPDETFTPATDEYRVKRILPASDGTHATASAFTDDQSNSPPASVYDRLDETPITTTAPPGGGDWIAQTTSSGSAYLEMVPETLDSNFLAMHIYAGSNAYSAGTAAMYAGLYRTSSPAGWACSSVDTSLGTAKSWQHDAGNIYLNDSADGTPAKWASDYRFRIGLSTDISPQPYISDLWVDVIVVVPAVVVGEGWGILLA